MAWRDRLGLARGSWQAVRHSTMVACRGLPGNEVFLTVLRHYNNAPFGDRHNADGSRPVWYSVCSWIDGDGSVGGDTAAYSIYLPHFATENDGSYQSKDR